MREGQSVLPYALCLASFCACGNPDPSTYAPRVDPGVTSFTIGASGGMVVSGDGTSVTIPQGALTQDVTITIMANPYAPALTQAQSLAVAHQFGPEGQKFLKPVTVLLEFDPGSLPPGATEQGVAVYSAPSDSNFYQSLETQIADSTHVTAVTSEFCNMYPGANGGGTVQLSAPVHFH
jgi:ZU5 domain-containing protein